MTITRNKLNSIASSKSQISKFRSIRVYHNTMDRKMSRSVTQDSRLIPSSESMEFELHNLSKNLESASNIHQLVKLLNTIDSKKKHVDNVLQKFTSKQSIAHRSSIRSLEVKRLEFTTTLSTSRTLRKTLDSAKITLKMLKF
ncbi:unnamed protein product [[Candida] boidinii]|nr:unnamed protein product [[Candida] boidinii]